MNTPDSRESEPSLDEQAAAWLIERSEGFTPERAALFLEWCNSNPRHATTLREVEQAMALLDDMPAIRTQLQATPAASLRSEFSDTDAVRPRLAWRWPMGLAAALMLGILTWWALPQKAPNIEQFAADATSARRVALADGSVVDLNSNGSLQVQFFPERRQITLERGEAHFQVAHDPAHPFIVTSKGISIRAVGTAFNVRTEGDRVEVLVTEGKVAIEDTTQSILSAKRALLVPLLVAGERTVAVHGAKTGPTIEKVSATTRAELLSWQNQMTTFTGVPLREMVARLNRCNSIHLVLGDQDLGDRMIGGVIDLNDVGAFVRLLEQDREVVAVRASRDTIILRRAR